MQMEFHHSQPTAQALTRGVLVHSPRQVALAHLPLEGAEERDRLEVLVEACGLCTWEQRVYKGDRKTYPFWGGHELCGVLADSGRPLPDGLAAGDRVAVALMRRCGHCRHCRRGASNHCAYVNPAPVGAGPRGPRGLSDRLFVEPYQVASLGRAVSPARGTLVEPLACALRSVQRAAPRLGERALVLGAGTMGLLHAALLAPLTERLVVADQEAVVGWMSGQPFELAAVEALRALGDGGLDHSGFDIIFCTRGGPDWISLALKLADRGGRVVLYQSIPRDDTLRCSANLIHYRELTILGTISQTMDDFAAAAALIRSRPALLDGIKVQEYLAEDCGEAFEAAVSGRYNRAIVRLAGASDPASAVAAS
jgi:L-iditol 2-dehydrogenase